MTKRENLPKLVASDIGGTLIRGTDIMPQFTANVLNRLVKEGIPVALITGFNYRTTMLYTRNLDKRVLLMPQNGSLCIREGELIWEYRFEEEKAKELHDYLKENGWPVIIYKGRDEDFANFYISSEELPLSRTFKRIDRLDSFDNITGISTLLPDKMAPATRDKIREIVGDRFEVIYTREVKGSWLETVHRDVRKDLALKRLCDELSVDISEVMYFGDNFNDREVLRAVGYPILVSNAQPEMKEEFHTVVGAVTEEGVAYYLDELFQMPE